MKNYKILTSSSVTVSSTDTINMSRDVIERKSLFIRLISEHEQSSLNVKLRYTKITKTLKWEKQHSYKMQKKNNNSNKKNTWCIQNILIENNLH